MAKRKSIEEALAAWENAKLEPDDDSQDDSEDWYDDFEEPEDNVCVDEEGTSYYG